MRTSSTSALEQLLAAERRCADDLEAAERDGAQELAQRDALERGEDARAAAALADELALVESTIRAEVRAAIEQTRGDAVGAAQAWDALPDERIAALAASWTERVLRSEP